MLVFLPYCFNWTIHSTFNELRDEVFRLRGSLMADFSMTFIIFTYSSSLHHLMFIGIERIYAIIQPFKYRMQTKSTIMVSLLVVWLSSLITSTIPRKSFFFIKSLVKVLNWKLLKMHKL